jgi:hypothetical protein
LDCFAFGSLSFAFGSLSFAFVGLFCFRFTEFCFCGFVWQTGEAASAPKSYKGQTGPAKLQDMLQKVICNHPNGLEGSKFLKGGLHLIHSVIHLVLPVLRWVLPVFRWMLLVLRWGLPLIRCLPKAEHLPHIVRDSNRLALSCVCKLQDLSKSTRRTQHKLHMRYLTSHG